MVRKFKPDLDKFRSQSLPPQEEIMATWKGEFDKPVVSVLCPTYNHKLYLDEALRGILTQRTSFPFEVILHDDASTDGTTDIVRKYASWYPKVIKPVIQKKNQYSQGKKPSLLSFAYAQGEYIAICEGDDFWINEEKLEKQHMIMVDHDHILISFHDGFMFYPDGQVKRYPVPNKKPFYSVSDMILGRGGVAPTASLMLHSKVFKNIPSWFAEVPYGDFYLQVIGSYLGNGAIYIDEKMSVYRVSSINSWSSMRDKNAEKIFQNEMHCHKYLSEYLGPQYKNEMVVVKSNYSYAASRSLLRIGKFELSIKYIKLSIIDKLFSPIRQFAVLILAWFKVKV